MQENNLQVKIRNRRHRRNEFGILFGSIVLCIITLTAVTFCLILVFKYRASQLENVAVMNELEEMQNRYTQEEVDALLSQRLEEASLAASEEAKEELLITMKELMLSGEGAVHMLRQFFPEEVVLADNNQYYFFPIMKTEN